MKQAQNTGNDSVASIRNNQIRTREHSVPLRMPLICAMLRERMSSNSTETKIERALIQRNFFEKKKNLVAILFKAHMLRNKILQIIIKNIIGNKVK